MVRKSKFLLVLLTGLILLLANTKCQMDLQEQTEMRVDLSKYSQLQISTQKPISDPTINPKISGSAKLDLEKFFKVTKDNTQVYTFPNNDSLPPCGLWEQQDNSR